MVEQATIWDEEHFAKGDLKSLEEEAERAPEPS